MNRDYTVPSSLVFSEGLASLRGVAAAGVVVYHSLLVFQVGPFDEPQKLPLAISEGWLFALHVLLAAFNGSAAVVLFFVLSGAVLALSLARSGQLTLRGLLAFYVRRLFRLLPLLATLALISGAMHIIYFPEIRFDTTTSWMARQFQRDPGIREILSNAVGRSHSLNTPAWTISIELAASFLLPAMYVASRRGAAVVLGVGMLLLAIMFLPHRGLHTFLFSFYVGCLVPRVGPTIAARFSDLPATARLVVIATTLLAMSWFGRVFSPGDAYQSGTVLMETVCAFLLVVVVYFKEQPGFLGARMFLFLGDISYGLYLIHFLVLFTLAHAIAPHLSAPLYPGDALALNLVLAITTTMVTILLAWLTYVTLERPFVRLGYLLSSRVGKGIKGSRPWAPQAVVK